MDKEEMLLKNFALLAKNPKKNMNAIKSAVGQLIQMNPKLGIRCWEECINNNIEELEQDFGKTEFSSNNIGSNIVRSFESSFCMESSFVDALDIFVRNKALLDVLYTKSPISTYCGVRYAISYLIRNNRLQEADNLLSAIYKNVSFTSYSKLWDNIIDMFKYGENYNPSGIYFSKSLVQPEHIRDFCIGWIERIKDEEEQASAMTFAMKMF